MDMTVKLRVFEGPLDLLLHLLDKNKVNIYDIPIVEITKQYMDYIREMKRHDLNVVSEFLVMAATLLDIKSKKCFFRHHRRRKKNRKIQERNWYNSFWNIRCINVSPMN